MVIYKNKKGAAIAGSDLRRHWFRGVAFALGSLTTPSGNCLFFLLQLIVTADACSKTGHHQKTKR